VQELFALFSQGSTLPSTSARINPAFDMRDPAFDTFSIVVITLRDEASAESMAVLLTRFVQPESSPGALLTLQAPLG